MGKNDCTSSKVQPWRKKKKGWGWLGESLSLPLSKAGFWLPVLVVWNNELILMVAGWLPALPPPLPSPPCTYTLPLPACLPAPARLPPPAAAAPDCLVCNNPQPHVPALSGSQGSGRTAAGRAPPGSARGGGGGGPRGAPTPAALRGPAGRGAVNH